MGSQLNGIFCPYSEADLATLTAEEKAVIFRGLELRKHWMGKDYTRERKMGRREDKGV